MLSRLMTKREQMVIVFGAGALILGSITIFLMRDSEVSSADAVLEVPEHPRAETTAIAEPVSSEVAPLQAGESSGEVVVSLVGAVSRPGVYTLEEGKRVQDLILAAGGSTRRADTTDLNLAAKLIDGTTLTVPGIQSESDGDGDSIGEFDVPATINIPEYTIGGWQTGASRGGASAGSAGGLIDINRATQAELESLPGIGPKYAQEIIRYRTGTRFVRTTDVLNVSGIGPKRYEAIRDLITVR